MLRKPIALLLLALLFTACSTGTSRLHQKFTLRAMDSKTYRLIKNATCIIKVDDEPEYKLTIPKTIELRRGKGNLAVTCTKPAYETAEEIVQQTINESFYDGLSNGVTRVSGFLDVLTGAVFDYPNQVTILMTRSSHEK